MRTGRPSEGRVDKNPLVDCRASMANIKSQIKRNRQNEKRGERNKTVRTALKTSTKKVRMAVDSRRCRRGDDPAARGLARTRQGGRQGHRAQADGRPAQEPAGEGRELRRRPSSSARPRTRPYTLGRDGAASARTDRWSRTTSAGRPSTTTGTWAPGSSPTGIVPGGRRSSRAVEDRGLLAPAAPGPWTSPAEPASSRGTFEAGSSRWTRAPGCSQSHAPGTITRSSGRMRSRCRSGAAASTASSPVTSTVIWIRSSEPGSWSRAIGSHRRSSSSMRHSVMMSSPSRSRNGS